MAGSEQVERGVVRDAVVHPLARVAQRRCARPGCPAPAAATLTFGYAAREAWIVGLADEADPQAYDLCLPHAGRTDPPHGWTLRDRRPAEERTPPDPRAADPDLGDHHTVAVLAAALRAAPESDGAEDVPSPVLGVAALDREHEGARPQPVLAVRDRPGGRSRAGGPPPRTGERSRSPARAGSSLERG